MMAICKRFRVLGIIALNPKLLALTSAATSDRAALSPWKSGSICRVLSSGFWAY